MKIDAIYAFYPESSCNKNLAIRKVFVFSDSAHQPLQFHFSNNNQVGIKLILTTKSFSIPVWKFWNQPGKGWWIKSPAMTNTHPVDESFLGEWSGSVHCLAVVLRSPRSRVDVDVAGEEIVCAKILFDLQNQFVLQRNSRVFHWRKPGIERQTSRLNCIVHHPVEHSHTW